MTREQQLRMTNLLTNLNDARNAYYTDTDNGETMSDLKYDTLLSELKTLETITDTQHPDSPTNHIGFAPPKIGRVAHCKPILSLKDTKSIDELLRFLGPHGGVLSWKLDGISIVLHYVNGIFINALTRGDGMIGLDITQNAILMKYVPSTIASRGSLFIRGEGCLSINEFEQIRKTKEGERYSNPRSAAAGIINTSTSPSILLKHMSFIAHSIVSTDDQSMTLNTYSDQLSYLNSLGFKSVEYKRVLNFQLEREIDSFTKQVADCEFPVDGLVLAINNLEYRKRLGATARFPKHSMAFKWPDERKTTAVTGMKWSVSRTGLITPVVIFEPIYLEGTIVKQANLHSLRIFEELNIGKGDILRVYKANKIVPEVEANLTQSKTESYPISCPVCGKPTVVIDNKKTRKLQCPYCALHI